MRITFARFGCFLLCCLTLLPASGGGVARAQEEDLVLSRLDGFMMLWRPLSRPAEFITVYPFRDVQEFDPGYVEVTYAKFRKILDREELFHPSDPLLLGDALVWLFRTRNIAYPQDVTQNSLPRHLRRYPIASEDSDLHEKVTEFRLVHLMRALDTALADEVHQVSFYADDFHGKGTAFGEPFDMHALTAAHRTFPEDTIVKVTNVENGKSVVVRINDRGPYVDGRDMDLSRAAFEEISPLSKGVIRATFERIGHVSLASTCAQPQRYQRRITRDVRFHRGVPHTFIMGESLTLGSTKDFVVREIFYPDGNSWRVQDFVVAKNTERFSFTPAIPGQYRFRVGTVDGRSREMRMEALICGDMDGGGAR